MSPRRLLPGLAAVVALAGCSAGALKPVTPASVKTAPAAPPFAARELGAKRIVSLASLRGKTVLLTSWATWCVDCRAELPAIQRLATSYGPRGLTVIGVNINAGSDDAGPLRYARDHGLTFPMLHDTASAFQVAFNAVGVPESALISRTGKLIAVWPGALDTAAAEPVINQALRS